jgi:hypothetical protein
MLSSECWPAPPPRGVVPLTVVVASPSSHCRALLNALQKVLGIFATKPKFRALLLSEGTGPALRGALCVDGPRVLLDIALASHAPAERRVDALVTLAAVQTLAAAIATAGGPDPRVLLPFDAVAAAAAAPSCDQMIRAALLGLLTTATSGGANVADVCNALATRGLDAFVLEPLWRLGVLRRAGASDTLEARMQHRSAGVARFAAELLRSFCYAILAARSAGGDEATRKVAASAVATGGSSGALLLSHSGHSVAALLDGVPQKREAPHTTHTHTHAHTLRASAADACRIIDRGARLRRGAGGGGKGDDDDAAADERLVRILSAADGAVRNWHRCVGSSQC